MNLSINKQLNNVLKHLYINPLEQCNLRCQICYTKKTNPILSNNQILDFIDRYKQIQNLETVTFCGGEVFTLTDFPVLVNILTAKNIIVQIITNGTIDKLKQIRNPNLINLIVSVDGLENYHDQNRGNGNFRKSILFIKKANKMGFHTEIFSIVTQQNYEEVDSFELNIKNNLGFNINVTYHPRKPLTYLNIHPQSNIIGKVKGFDFLTDEQIKYLMKNKNTFPPQNLGCYQIALMSDGKIYGCCEGITPIGNITDSIDLIIEKLKSRLIMWETTTQNTLKCLGCVEPGFVCGLKHIINKI